MPEGTLIRKRLHPITLEAQIFLKAMEKYGPKYPKIDEELLNTMDKLVNAINKFYDQPLTKFEETEEIKLATANDLDCIKRVYSCTQCKKRLGPTAESAVNHFAHHHGKKKLARSNKQCDRAPATELKLPLEARKLLNRRFSTLVKRPAKVAKKLQQIPEYDQIENELTNAFQPLFPDKTIEVYKFGSRISGIGNENSDLDIYVDIGNTFSQFENRGSQGTINTIQMVAKALHGDENWKDILTLENVRVPIIRVLHTSTNISCDIGISNSLGYCSTMLMKYFFELQPVASRLCIFMKLWLESTKLNEHFTSYSIILMVIFYLQVKEILPSVEKLQSNLEKPLFVGPWIRSFEQLSLNDLSLKEWSCTRSILRELLLGFFSFYREFDFGNWVVCPYFGYMIKIDDIINRLPETYKNFVESNEGKFKLQTQTPMIVQDPIQLNLNVTKGRSAHALEVLVDYIKDSSKLISQRANPLHL